MLDRKYEGENSSLSSASSTFSAALRLFVERLKKEELRSLPSLGSQPRRAVGRGAPTHAEAAKGRWEEAGPGSGGAPE